MPLTDIIRPPSALYLPLTPLPPVMPSALASLSLVKSSAPVGPPGTVTFWYCPLSTLPGSEIVYGATSPPEPKAK